MWIYYCGDHWKLRKPLNIEVLVKENHQEDKEIGTLTQGHDLLHHGNIFGRLRHAKERSDRER